MYTASLHAADLAGLIEKLNSARCTWWHRPSAGVWRWRWPWRGPSWYVRSVLAEPPLMPWLEHIPGGTPLAQAFYADAWRPAQLAFREGDSEHGVRLFLDGVIGRGPSIVSRRVRPLSPSGQRMILDNAAEMRAETLSLEIFPG